LSGSGGECISPIGGAFLRDQNWIISLDLVLYEFPFGSFFPFTEKPSELVFYFVFGIDPLKVASKYLSRARG